MKTYYTLLLSSILCISSLSASGNYQGIYDTDSDIENDIQNEFEDEPSDVSNHLGIDNNLNHPEDEPSDESSHLGIDNNNPNNIESNTNERDPMNQVMLPKGSTIPVLEMTPNPFSTPIPPQNSITPHDRTPSYTPHQNEPQPPTTNTRCQPIDVGLLEKLHELEEELEGVFTIPWDENEKITSITIEFYSLPQKDSSKNITYILLMAIKIFTQKTGSYTAM